MSEAVFEVRDGYIPVTGGRVWYKVVGSGDAIPLLALHGGPGLSHDYLNTLLPLAEERPVILYDQLGGGKSDHPDDLSLWVVERFVEELGQVREALGLRQIHLLGHSWGSMLATDYVLTKPSGLASLILASPPLSMPLWVEGLARLRSALPMEVQAVLDKHEAAGTIDSEEYEDATMEYYRRHLLRMDPWPVEIMDAFHNLSIAVYGTMWGPNELLVTGNLKSYDRAPRLHEITVPTLFTCGRYDEATPEGTAELSNLVPRSEFVIFERSAHFPDREETDRYLSVVRDFLSRVEKKSGSGHWI